MKKIILLLCFFVLGSFGVNALDLPDRSVISDWYIKDYQTEITVNTDRSLNIVEKIIADAGNLPNKHGIFRNIPKSVERNGRVISLPLKLRSITDFSSNPHKYDSSLDFMNNVQVWKIGDANKTVNGENEYKIDYLMKNAVYTLDEGFDELYWNVLGAFWTLEIDNFKARIVLPDGLNKENTEIEIFSGYLGATKDELNSSFEWISSDVLEISAMNIKKENGLTVSLKFPKGVFVVEKESFLKKNIWFLIFLLPLILFLICFKIWEKDGKDFKDNKAIMPMFFPPKDLSILEIGTIWKNGKNKKEFLSAEIINLAVKGFLTIEQTKGFFGFGKTYVFKASEKAKKDLSFIEKSVYDAIFSGKKEVSLASIKHSFYSKYQTIKSSVLDDLDSKGFFNRKSLTIQVVFTVLFFVFLSSFVFLLIFTFTINEAFIRVFLIMSIAIGLSSISLLVFALIMPQRTEKGVDLHRNILGFKMYMETAEKFRQQFNEKENIFEKYLPYAIMFNMTKLWIKKFRNLYGDDYFINHPSLWLLASGSALNNINQLSSIINSVSRDIGSSMGSSSSSGGGGGGGSSGGGGGGGGGGGW